MELKIIASAFAIDDSENQLLADYYGVVMGTRGAMFNLSEE